MRIEAEELYKGFIVSDRKTGNDIPGGLLWRQKLDENKREDNSRIQNYLLGVWAGKHRYLLKTIALLFAAGFALMGAGLSFFYHQSATPICIGGV
jgi:hypothetical protein